MGKRMSGLQAAYLFTSAHFDGVLPRLPAQALCARLRALNTP